MQFPSIKIENFLAISTAEIKMSQRGLVLIQGVNDEDTSAKSNGAGKSSIADALCWCLFGTTARGIAGDAVVNRETGKNCAVTVEIDDDGQLWRISRHRKHKPHKNLLRVQKFDPPSLRGGPNWTDLTAGTDKLTQEIVDKIVGCSYEIFSAAIYAGYERMPDLPGMTDKMLKVLVEEAAGVGVLDEAHSIALSDSNTAKGAVAGVSDALSRQEARLAQLINDQTRLNNDAEDYERARKAQIESREESLRRSAGLARSKRDAIEARKPDIADKRSQLAKIKDFLATGIALEKAQEQRLVDAVNKAKATHIRLAAGKDQADRDVQKFEASVAEVDDSIGKPCRECGRPHEAKDLENHRKAALTRLTDAQHERENASSKSDDAFKALQSVTDALSSFRATMTDVTETIALSDSLQRDISSFDREVADLQIDLRALQDMKAEIVRVKSETNPYEKMIRERAEEIEEQTLAIKSTRESLEKAIEIKRYADAAREVFSPAGVRAHILDTVTPFLNDRTAIYLGALSDGMIEANWSTLTKDAKGNLKERFAIDVTHQVGGESFAALSGGEKRKVRIATALALQDLVTSRAGKAIELFIGDEIDDALDEAGLERLMGILEEKAKERGSVFIISHRSLKDWISNVIVVTKKGLSSTIEEIVT